MENNEKPKFFKVLKIIGFCLIGLGFILILMGICTNVPDMGSNGWFEASKTKSSLIFGGVGSLMFSAVVLTVAYRPELEKLRTKTTKYIQEQNKEDLTDIASNTADIAGEAITKTTKAIKEGLEDKIFCKHCGAKIDADSKFCNKCGKEQ